MGVPSIDLWELLTGPDGGPLSSKVNAIHAALLPDGTVVWFAGSEHNEKRGYRTPTCVWDPADPHQVREHPSPALPSAADDLFCAGHSALADGNLLVAGGTEKYDRDTAERHRRYQHFTGIRSTWVFDWRTKTWRRTGDLQRPRWYPTLLTLPDGRVLAVSGHDDDAATDHEVTATEVYDPVAGVWGPATELKPPVTDTGRFRILWIQLVLMVYYWRLFVLPDGSVFSATALRDGNGRRAARSWDVGTGVLTTRADAPPGRVEWWQRNVYARANFTAVLLPLRPANGYRAEVLVANGRQPYRLELGPRATAWRRAGSKRPYRVRAYGTSVLLPDGSVLLVNGGRSEKMRRWFSLWKDVGGYDRHANSIPERYLPDADTWETGGPRSGYPPVPRMYHSVAVLLPDGRVWIGGSNHDSLRTPREDEDPEHPGHGGHANELRLELYSPPYLFDGRNPDGTPRPAPRPTVDPATGDTAAYGARFDVRTPDAGRVRRVTLLRTGAVTHGYNSDQRLVELAVDAASRTADRLTVTMPPSARIAPPGYYLLFALDAAGHPSVGHAVRLG